MCEYSETSEDNDWVSERRGKHRGGVNPGSSHGQLSKDLHQRNAWQSTKNKQSSESEKTTDKQTNDFCFSMCK